MTIDLQSTEDLHRRARALGYMFSFDLFLVPGRQATAEERERIRMALLAGTEAAVQVLEAKSAPTPGADTTGGPAEELSPEELVDRFEAEVQRDISDQLLAPGMGRIEARAVLVARLDAARTAKPLTRLIAHVVPGDFVGPGGRGPDAIEEVATGKRVALTDDEKSRAVISDGPGHDGPGWYYHDEEYPEEGSVGAFESRGEAAAHAREDHALTPEDAKLADEWEAAHPRTDIDRSGWDGEEYLEELRGSIDDHLGWADQESEDGGDYVERVKQVAGLLRASGIHFRHDEEPRS